MSDLTRILVIEDDPDHGVLFQLILESEGFSVDLEPSPSKALQRLTEDTYHLVITDIMMPQMSGEELISQIRGKSEHSNISIIAMSSGEEVAVSDADGVAGPDMFYSKRKDKDDLVGMVHALLKNA